MSTVLSSYTGTIKTSVVKKKALNTVLCLIEKVNLNFHHHFPGHGCSTYNQ